LTGIAGADGTVLVETFSKEQGLPAIYMPFQTAIAGDPELLTVLDDDVPIPEDEEPAFARVRVEDDAPDMPDMPETLDIPDAPDMPEEVILERDGIHYINSHVLAGAGEKSLDQKFLDLVESVTGSPESGPPL
jgi:hypothetical protein